MLNIFKQAINPFIHHFGAKKMKKNFPIPPLLIGGCGRSGTTLLLSILSSHPEIFAFDYELSAFNHWIKGTKNNQLKPKRLDRLHRYILFSKIPKTVKLWCEKTPRNVLYLKEIFDYFNNEVKFIHIIRDGRDVTLSKHPDNPDEYWVSPERWVNDVRAGLAYANHQKVFTLKYEDLVSHYQESMQKICAFVGIGFHNNLKNWHEHSSVRKNNAWYGEVKQLNTASVGKWKNSKYRQRIKEVMSNQDFVDLLKELNYEVKE